MITETPFRLLGKKPHIISLMLLSAFASMGAVLMAPALPQMSHFFKISMGSTQLVVTSFLFGFAIGQLIYGPFANRWGRKSALYIGVGIATLGSLLSILSSPFESFHLLLWGRFIEALGASAGLAVCFTVINDFYFPQQARRITAILMIAFAIVPGIAIAVGGNLTQYINWQACFYFLLFYGLMLIYPVFHLPETISQFDHRALHHKQILKNYSAVLHNKKLIGYSLLSGLSSANIYVFGAAGPFIGIHILHIAPALYGFLGLIPYIGVLLGSAVVIRLTNLDVLLVLKFAFLLQLIAAIIMLICFALHDITLMTLFIPMGILCVGHPMIASTALSLAMQQIEDKANGSAIMNFLAISMPVLMTFILGALHITAAWMMPCLFLLALFLMLVIHKLICKK